MPIRIFNLISSNLHATASPRKKNKYTHIYKYLWGPKVIISSGLPKKRRKFCPPCQNFSIFSKHSFFEYNHKVRKNTPKVSVKFDVAFWLWLRKDIRFFITCGCVATYHPALLLETFPSLSTNELVLIKDCSIVSLIALTEANGMFFSIAWAMSDDVSISTANALWHDPSSCLVEESEMTWFTVIKVPL